MAERDVSPDVYSYSSAIAACDRAGEWEGALALLDLLHAFCHARVDVARELCPSVAGRLTTMPTVPVVACSRESAQS